MSGEIRSQKTEIYVLDTADTGSEVKKLANIVGVGEFGAQAGDIITSNLDSEAVEKLSGLVDNGDLALTINVKDGDAGHEFLEDNAGSSTRYQIIICDSTGTTQPTYATSTLTLPTDRNVRHFMASIKSYRYGALSPDSVWTATVNLGISGAVTVVRKA